MITEKQKAIQAKYGSSPTGRFHTEGPEIQWPTRKPVLLSTQHVGLPMMPLDYLGVEMRLLAWLSDEVVNAN